MDDNNMMNTDFIKSVSSKVFGYDPKPEQIETMKLYCDGKDSVVVAPTGWGKSLIYQIAPFLLDTERYSITATTASKSNNVTATTTLVESYHSDVTTDISTLSLDECLNRGPVNVGKLGTVSEEAQPHELAALTDCDLLSAEFGDIDTLKHSTPDRPEREGPAKEDTVEELSSWLQEIDISVEPLRQQATTRKKSFAQFLIIMPLVALITDAILKVRQLIPQVSAVHLSPSTLTEAKSAILIFTSPENILASNCGRLLLQTASVVANLKTIFIDEFHIIAAWGLSSGDEAAFREAYGQLGQLRAFISHVPFVCLSATASDEVITRVKSSLHLKSPKIIKVEINKRNITYHTLRVKGSVIEDFRWLFHLILRTTADQLPRILIFYNNIDYLADAYQYVMYHANQLIGDPSPICVMFHLITDPLIKQAVLKDLAEVNGRIRIVFCSKSLSMGLNLAQIKYVIHYGPPTTADAFIQETGRAARESGLHAHSILLTFPRMASGRTLDDTMKDYLSGKECLRSTLLAKFHCVKPTDQQNCCDICDDVSCDVMKDIIESYESSATDSFSDSDSVVTAGEMDDDIDDESVFWF